MDYFGLHEGPRDHCGLIDGARNTLTFSADTIKIGEISEHGRDSIVSPELSNSVLVYNSCPKY